MNRTFKPNRQGITLLFVISMIVLFLLMGTAFVIVSNNFNRESTRRIRVNQLEGRGSQLSNALLEGMIAQIIRGPDLRNIDSPLRANDLLSDQYGYGVKSFVSGNVALKGDEAFIEFTLQSDDPSASDEDKKDAGLNLLTGGYGALSPSGLTLNNSYGGRVLSFTSGPAKGFSARIYSDTFNSGNHLFRIPTVSVTGQSITTTAGLVGSEVIINGRDFGGTGAAVTLDANLNPTGLGPQALLPNRAGQSYQNLAGITDESTNPSVPPTASFLSQTDSSGNITSNPASVNEPWDAADIANPFLSGFDKAGRIIASFHRQALITNGPTSTANAGRTYFHAFDIGGDNLPDVDADGDGTNDSFWMSTGEPIVTNGEGQRFRPLFAIHIRDLDGLLNVNAHSNWTHTDTDQNSDGKLDGFVNVQQTWAGGGNTPPASPLGLGMGPAEINMTTALNGTANLAAILNARYSGDLDTDTTDNELPGNGLTSFRSRAKLFGHPNTRIDPANNQFGTIGGFYGSSMDLFGRFTYGFPSSSNSGFINYPDPNFANANFNNSLPQINMLTSKTTFTRPGSLMDEFSGNPYEMSISGSVPGDSPFTIEELERLLRPEDIDSIVLPDRLSELLTNDASINPRLFTTDSFEVPTLYQDFVETMARNIQLRNTTLADGDVATAISLLSAFNGQFAFAPELFRGLKMDINRPWGNGRDDNNNGVIDEPTLETATNNEENDDAENVLGDGETGMNLTYGETSAGTPRGLFARNLYVLAMLLLEPVDMDKDGTLTAADRLAFAKAMAQWAVNVVDFRDADSIHTRFVYDPTPFDAQGWNPTTDASGNPLPAASIAFVWGAERPELLLTETLAVHVQNLEKRPGGDPNMPTYQQRLRPQPFAYFEVYNPWTQNRLNQSPPAELYGTTGGVQLGRKAGNSPVWRFEVERVNTSGATPTYKPLRYVYMTDTTNSPVTYNNTNEDQVAGDIEIFFNTGNTTSLLPGRQAVIGTKGFEDPDAAGSFQVFMGRRTDAVDTAGDYDEIQLDDTTRLALNAGANTVTRYTGNTAEANPRSTSIVFIDQSATGVSPANGADRKFSLSDPYEGYPDEDSTPAVTGMEIPDGFVYDNPTQGPLDMTEGDSETGRINATDISMIRSDDGTNKNFRYVRLQRLANPLIAWNAVTNPYLTIDSMEVDLVTINGADPVATPPPLPPGQTTVRTPESMDNAVSHERGNTTDTDTAREQLWGFQREGTIRTAMGVDASTDHYFAGEFDESLGRTNDLFAPATAGNPFPWLAWNNRPFVSHTEIMNVPYLAPDRLTYAPEPANDDLTPYPTQPFTVGDATGSDGMTTIDDPFGSSNNGDAQSLEAATRSGALAGRYGHLLNFFAAEDDTTGSTNAVLDVYKLLDFIEVPSRFVDTEAYYLTAGDTNDDAFKHPFNTISRYRVPGKININTIPPGDIGLTTSVVWNALLADYATVNGSTVAWNNLRNSLYGDYTARDPNDATTGPDMATDFENPFRPAVAANLVPGGPEVVGSACSLLRPAVAGGGAPLFDYTSTAQTDNSNKSATFRNGIRTRLGNLVTNKSSVFACWITVGYFEVDANGNLLQTDGNTIGGNLAVPPVPTGTVAEIGADSGEQVRNRAFFIFDRSIPVAFEPGKNHNIDQAILIKSIIE